MFDMPCLQPAHRDWDTAQVTTWPMFSPHFLQPGHQQVEHGSGDEHERHVQAAFSFNQDISKLEHGRR